MTERLSLPVGLYDRVVTKQLAETLDRLARHRQRSQKEKLDPEESHAFLTKAISEVLSNALRAMPTSDRVDAQLDLCNRVLDAIATSPTRYHIDPDEHLLGERLLAVLEQGDGLTAGAEIQSPGIPLGQTSLLVNAPRDHQVGAEVRREIESADSVDLLCSFIKWSGYIRLRSALQRHCERGRPLRVITTTYMGATEARALDELHGLGAQIRVSYDSRRTRLHAKAWYFQRDTGFDTAFIGSSNLSAAALSDGLEWNVRVSARELPRVASKFRATFDTYWSDEEFEPYDPSRDAVRLRKSLKQSSTGGFSALSLIDIRPYPFQREIIEKLWTERRVHKHWKNLVVAATGTGKTIIAALDYRQALRELGSSLSLLFIAHRKEILEQSLATFRQVLRQADFGELHVGGLRAEEGTHLFASVQSLANVDLRDIPPDRFDVVIVDEVHHAAAPTYERLLAHFKPGILLGLTATPERTDGGNIKDWFDGRFAAELRLWDAIDRGLLAPFQYFVLNDDVDLSRIRWARGRYSQSELEDLYTGNDARVRLIHQAIQNHVPDLHRIRALGFCAGVDHAKFMARRFNDLGIPAAALTGETDNESRRACKEQLRAGKINVLFTVDLFNEGVDIPDVDTVLFLRPTESAMLFLQQLGRGLRLSEGKECLTVLDFVGHTHKSFRFDLRFRALTGATRKGLPEQVEQGFPFLPSGCSVQLDRVAQKIVLENLKQAISNRRSHLVQELRTYPEDVSLATFLTESQLELTDIYRGGRCWTDLRRDAGFPSPERSSSETAPLRAVGRVLHWDDPDLLDLGRQLMSGTSPASIASSTLHRRTVGMILSSLYGSEGPADIERFLDDLRRHQTVREELQNLLPILRDKVQHQPVLNEALQLKGIPLKVHCTYSRDEIMAAHHSIKGGRLYLPREGVYFDEETQHNLLFVTLQKSEKEYSPTTMYDDYAISPELFHWQSQSNTSTTSKKGRRHVGHMRQGITPLLFVRNARKDDRGATAPYLFLGPLEYQSHTGDRPMDIVWKLKYPMPMDAFRAARVVGG